MTSQAIVNEDPNAKMIRELHEEIARLKASILTEGSAVGGSEVRIYVLFNVLFYIRGS